MPDELQLLREARPAASGPSAELTVEARGALLSGLAPASGRRRWRLRIAVPALAAAALAAGLGTAVLGRGSESAWAAELVRVAEAAPRLLLSEPGWHVTRADQFSVERGEMTFANGTRSLELRWQPAGEHARTIADRAVKGNDESKARVSGVEARVFRYAGTNDFTALWVRDGYGLEARGLADDAGAFRALLASLREVDVDAWLSALPESVVKPDARADVVDAMLAGIPLPPDYDAASLRRGEAVRDRYQLGAQVAGSVACAWMDLLVSSRRQGDRDGERAAATALSTSHDWAVLHEMNDNGDYPEVLWESADAIVTSEPVRGGKPLAAEDAYASALGCPHP